MKAARLSTNDTSPPRSFFSNRLPKRTPLFLDTFFDMRKRSIDPPLFERGVRRRTFSFESHFLWSISHHYLFSPSLPLSSRWAEVTLSSHSPWRTSPLARSSGFPRFFFYDRWSPRQTVAIGTFFSAFFSARPKDSFEMCEGRLNAALPPSATRGSINRQLARSYLARHSLDLGENPGR